MGYKYSSDLGTHSPCRILIIILNILIYAAHLTFNFLSNARIEGSDLFNNSIGDVSRKYSTKITPSGWTFSIWYMIYGWQAAYMIYTLTLLCRKTKDGEYLYISPGHIPYSFYAMYITVSLLITGWVFLYSYDQVVVALVFIFLLTLGLYACGILVCRGLDVAGGELEKQGCGQEIWLTRTILINALAVYGTWCTCASWIGFAQVLQYQANVDPTTCAWISLGVLAVKVLIWFILETFAYDRYLRYCYGQYIVLIIAFSGVLSNHYDAENLENYVYFVIALLALSGFLALVKLIVMIARGMVQPIVYKSEFEPTLAR